MELYYDGWCVIKVNPETNRAIYANQILEYCEMSINVANYIVKKLHENQRLGYNLIDIEMKRWKHFCGVISKEAI